MGGEMVGAGAPGSTRSGLLPGLVAAAAVLALGLVAGAFVLGNAGRQAAAARQSIVVKGLAEKPVKADRGELLLSLQGRGASPSEALAQLRKGRETLLAFVTEQGYQGEQVEVRAEDFSPSFKRDKNGMETEEVAYYQAHQDVVLRSAKVDQIARTEKDTMTLRERGLALTVAHAAYLVSDLEAVKMSLIGSATQNAYVRAGEFAKHGNVQVGAMKSASQGAFYILPDVAGGNTDNDYGGVYDKSTINKIARVVVSIEYSIQP